MHEDFWQERWARNEIGFHLDDVHPGLRRHWPRLAVPAGAAVLVPLCGKSLDLAWLAGQGYRVLGVELSQKAVEAFSQNSSLKPRFPRKGRTGSIAPARWKSVVAISSRSVPTMWLRARVSTTVRR